MTRKKLMIIGGAVVAQAAVAWALMVFVVGPKLRGEPFPWDKAKEEAAAAKEREKASGHELGELLPIDEILVNVAGTKGRRFCRASITLEMQGEELSKKAKGWLPVYRGKVLDLLSAKDMDQLTAPGARDSLKTEILQTLNADATGGKFSDLFFTEFLVQ
ncbi:MAG: flagellar basal body-associated FliL family protein [bacterium]